MTENSAASGIVEPVSDLCTYAVDVWVEDESVLTDVDLLLGVLRNAAQAGKAHVLGEATHVFPNGAVTAILLLSASHLTIHTWPEYNLANIDLLAYGRLNAELMIGVIEDHLKPVEINTSRLLRSVSAAPKRSAG